MVLSVIESVDASLSLWGRLMNCWSQLRMFLKSIRSYWRDKADLARAVPLLEVEIERNRLSQKPTPLLVVCFHFLNCSVFDVRISGIAGRFRFGQGELSGDVEADATRDVANRFESVGVTVKQWISPDEAELILQHDGNHLSLGVANLRIYATAAGLSTPRQHSLNLSDGGSLSFSTEGRWRAVHTLRPLFTPPDSTAERVAS